MNVTTEPRENRQLALTIEVEQERVDAELRQAARKVSQELRIPGFRKGKAPYNMVVRYVGLPYLYNEFVERLNQELFPKALEQEGIEPSGISSLEDVSYDPLAFTLIVPLEPIVTLGDYRALRVDPVAVEVSDADVDAQVQRTLTQHATWQEVSRPTQFGDSISIDVTSVLLDENGDVTDEFVLQESDWEILPDEENPMEPDGFDAALIGLEPGQESEFVLSWSEESQSMYAGRSARFQVKVNAIQAFDTPELTDEFVQELDNDHNSVAELMESTRADLVRSKTEENETAYIEAVFTALIEQSTLEYPPAMVEDQISSNLANVESQVRQMGIESLERYLEMIGQSVQSYRASLRTTAEAQLRRNLLLYEIIENEKLTVPDEEFDAYLEKMLGKPQEIEGEEPEDEEARQQQEESFKQFAELMRREPNRSALESQLLTEKAMERLLAIARGEEVPEIPADVEEIVDQEEGQETDVQAEEDPSAESEDVSEAEPTQGGSENG